MSGMISFEVFVTLLITILTSGSISAVTFYINAKKTSSSQAQNARRRRTGRNYDSAGFKIIIFITTILIVCVTGLYFSNNLLSFVSKISLLRFFPFYSELFSNSRFTALYIVDSVLSIALIIFLIYGFHDEGPIIEWYGYILEPLFIILLGYGLIWLNFFVSYLCITYIQFSSDFFFFGLSSVCTVVLYLVIFVLTVFLAEKIAEIV